MAEGEMGSEADPGSLSSCHDTEAQRGLAAGPRSSSKVTSHRVSIWTRPCPSASYYRRETILTGRGGESQASSPDPRDLLFLRWSRLLCIRPARSPSSGAGPPLSHLCDVATRKFKSTNVRAWFSVVRWWSTLRPFNPVAT